MGTHNQCFRSYSSETESHIRRKFDVWLRLIKAGCIVYTEAIFLNGKRADIFAIMPDGRCKIIEILESESHEECEAKITNYPEVDDVIIVRELNEGIFNDILC